MAHLYLVGEAMVMLAAVEKKQQQWNSSMDSSAARVFAHQDHDIASDSM